MINDNYHQSVMVDEVIKFLHIKKSAKYIDATLGTGGHTQKIIEAGGEVLGIEMDPKMLAIATDRLKDACPTPKLVQGNFTDVARIASGLGFSPISGILFDLGVSNLHLTADTRGFSFSDPEASLDMRLDPQGQAVTAADLLNALDRTQLTKLFGKILGFPSAKYLAEKVFEAREIKPFVKVGDLLLITAKMRAKTHLNPSTLPMLALRIAVNTELENLYSALPSAFELLEKGGRLIVITFHSKEQEIVEAYIKDKGKLVLPTSKEVESNPRARSAKLWVMEK